MNYILMGDIIDSRGKNSKLLWKELNEIIQITNNEFRLHILSPLQMKIGDEFQVIMKDITSSLQLLYYLDIYLMHKGIKSRFVIGYGEIETTINPYSADNMLGDGLTFTHDILDDKKNPNRYRFYIQDNQKEMILLNSIGILLTEIEQGISKKQYDFLFYKVIMKYNIVEIANKMHITQRSVYGFYERSNYELFQNIFASIEDVLI